MTLKLTPEMLAAAYDFLCATHPFQAWNLPESEDVAFKVSKRTTEFGRYQLVAGKHTISMSVRSIGQTETLLKYLAHEMLHLYLEQMGWESKSGGGDTHNTAFRKFAAQVCKYHGFDLRAFY